VRDNKMDKLDEIFSGLEREFQNSLGSASSFQDREYGKKKAKSAILNLLLTEEEILGIINNICGWNFKAEILVKALNSAQLRKVGV
jgi:hypothetical protein